MQAGSSNKDKKILQVSTSALVGLKAALYSKQQAAKREQANTVNRNESHTRKVSEKTASIWNRKQSDKVKGQKPIKSSARERTEEAKKVLSEQEERELSRSRQALEAKAKLYEKLSKGQGLREVEGQDGEESRYMVDFTKKIYEGLQDNDAKSAVVSPQTLAIEPSPPSEGSQGSPKGKSPPLDEEEWVEYEDEFGRTRKCLKADLSEMMSRSKRSPSPQLLSEDMRRERERVRWEREAEAELEEPVGPVHYQSVQAGEVRNHGVGYYRFSESEEERKKQLDMLEQLRDETTSEREKKQRLKDKRKALLEARLNKVKERRNQQRRAQGLTDIEFEIGGNKEQESKEVSSNDIRALLDAELERSKVNASMEQEKIEEGKRAKHVRPWDRGKVVDMVKKRKQELEEERLPEFAPPTSYNPGTAQKKPRTDSKELSSTIATNTNDEELSSTVTNTSISTPLVTAPSVVPGYHSNPLSLVPPPPPWFMGPPPNFIPPPPFLWQPFPPPPPPSAHYTPTVVQPPQNNQDS